jgi:hypothetical protein
MPASDHEICLTQAFLIGHQYVTSTVHAESLSNLRIIHLLRKVKLLLRNSEVFAIFEVCAGSPR